MQEIERKFLVNPEVVNHIPADAFRYEIQQGYLVVGDPEVRVRGKNTNQCFFTIKRGTGLVREEQETAISRVTFDALYSMCVTKLEKTRYVVSAQHKFEIDVFSGKCDGLVLLEVELVLPDELIAFPTWLRKYIIKEVTYDKRYKNQNLAQFGIPTPS